MTLLQDQYASMESLLRSQSEALTETLRRIGKVDDELLVILQVKEVVEKQETTGNLQAVAPTGHSEPYPGDAGSLKSALVVFTAPTLGIPAVFPRGWLDGGAFAGGVRRMKRGALARESGRRKPLDHSVTFTCGLRYSWEKQLPSHFLPRESVDM